MGDVDTYCISLVDNVCGGSWDWVRFQEDKKWTGGDVEKLNTLLRNVSLQVCTSILSRIEELGSIKAGRWYYRIKIEEEETSRVACPEENLDRMVEEESKDEEKESSIPSMWSEDNTKSEEDWGIEESQRGRRKTGVSRDEGENTESADDLPERQTIGEEDEESVHGMEWESAKGNDVNEDPKANKEKEAAEVGAHMTTSQTQNVDAGSGLEKVVLDQGDGPARNKINKIGLGPHRRTKVSGTKAYKGCGSFVSPNKAFSLREQVEMLVEDQVRTDQNWGGKKMVQETKAMAEELTNVGEKNTTRKPENVGFGRGKVERKGRKKE
ncbi:hypothetical protein L6452_07399 [Arctium lappa]|uniref:Uncharacterized protein n=1 Tax=Arctium lappa TaxID=4217 RepID=A0ACB9ELG3_ARCLA|nr:hypothetical protein L6452_07399 [Arctium lappa]